MKTAFIGIIVILFSVLAMAFGPAPKTSDGYLREGVVVFNPAKTFSKTLTGTKTFFNVSTTSIGAIKWQAYTNGTPVNARYTCVPATFSITSTAQGRYKGRVMDARVGWLHGTGDNIYIHPNTSYCTFGLISSAGATVTFTVAPE